MSDHQGAWGPRQDQGAWWSGGAVAADQQQALQQHQHMMHTHQMGNHQQVPQQQQQQQPPPQHDPRSTAGPTMHEYSYKMANSFQNSATTVSNVSSTSPIGAAGIRGYDYRLGGGNMTGGHPAMSGPPAGAQWWYPNPMDNMQNHQQNNMQTMPSVHTPPPSQAQQPPLNQQQVDAQRQHQEAQRHHQEAQQRHQQEAEARHHQAVAEAQARHQQQQQQNHHQLQIPQQRPQQLNHQNHIHQQYNQLQHQQLANLQQQHFQKGRMPRGKANAKPRGRMTAYACFVQTCREEHKKKHPEETVAFAEFSKKCAEKWKTMVDKEKKRFHEMAEKDKMRYDAEMQNYTPPKGEKQRGKKRKQTKDPNAPKRSLSAFFWFSNDERSKVKQENPEYGVGDIAKELGRRWADADAETKGRYVVMAEKDKARYEKEMTAYKKEGSNPSVQEPVPEPDEEEEEDDLDDEDDD